MKRTRQLGWQGSAFGAAAIVALGLTLGLTPRTARAQACTGDCNHDGQVTVNELITMVNIALGNALISTCTAGDANGDGQITINEIIQAVGYALNSCPTGPTPTPTPGTTGVCGDGHVDAGEQCDDGGTCTGGSDAGKACTAESDCDASSGICEGGTKYFSACANDAGCPGGKCIHCKTFGGDGCAANCTLETDLVMDLKPGHATGLTIDAGTSGAVVHGDILTIPLPLTGQETLTVGGQGADGNIPITIKAASIKLPAIPVSSIACACLRGVPAKTCGGTLFESDGVTQSTDCSDNSTAGASVCTSAGLKPCSFLHGPGNSASGVVGCGPGGYAPVDVTFDLNSGGSSGVAGKPIVTLSGSGPTGSVLLLSDNAIGTTTGLCTGSDTTVYGTDGKFCTADDPQSSQGTQSPAFDVTGTATGMIEGANGTDGDNLGGPFSATGNPLVCSNPLTVQSLSGAGLASAFDSLNQPTLGDIITVSALVGQ